MRFLENSETFVLEEADRHSGLYFPLASENGLKSAVTPDLHGDAKLDQNHFVLEPKSIEGLSEELSSRNFWCRAEAEDGTVSIWSATGCSMPQKALRFTDEEESVKLTAGYMWQSVEREGSRVPLKSTITSFIPWNGNAEIHIVTVENMGKETLRLTAMAAIPVYGRSADNIRDHRHVTSLLHRIRTDERGATVVPTMSFDERGHQRNHTAYFVRGVEADGTHPEAFYPDLDAFVGEGGNLYWPQAVVEDLPGCAPGFSVDGREAMGGLRFAARELAPGESAAWLVFAGSEEEEGLAALPANLAEAEAMLDETRKHWRGKVQITFRTGDKSFDAYMRWIAFQPELRRLFGCSFLPHHDYGRGGRGWRDLWQDCLALLLMDPESVRPMLVSNFGGVCEDGTNATIIGEEPGEFKADRNGIPRIWMDHAFWPLLTMLLYIDQTGDTAILEESAPYFGSSRTGTVLEHLILQNLHAAWDLGEHGCIRLRGADWNDALDLAADRGESVAFTHAYVMNLESLCELLGELEEGKLAELGKPGSVLSEQLVTAEKDGAKPDENRASGTDGTLSATETDGTLSASGTDGTLSASGTDGTLSATETDGTLSASGTDGMLSATGTDGTLADRLKTAAKTLRERLRGQEWMEGTQNDGWYNGYYDNHGNRLEGSSGENGIPRMLLTSQVFAVMAGTADDEQVKKIVRAADRLLYDEDCGGYRLNTDFGEVKMDMGRMFGFAFGEKENGAVFSHMTVMFANALYSRGFAQEGSKALSALYRQASDIGRSHMLPGIPEYFDQNGRGLYSWLTGAGSWYLMTMVCQVFGIRGRRGDLVIEPKLLAEQFDKDGCAGLALPFAGRHLNIRIRNEEHLTYPQYRIERVLIDETEVFSVTEGKGDAKPGLVILPRGRILSLAKDQEHEVTVELR